jgi:hypothetical protein
MDIQQIKILLGKFEKAETSLDEEKVLHEYFWQHTDVPAELEAYRAYFQYCESEGRKVHENAALKNRLEALFDKHPSVLKLLPSNRKIYRWVAAAAMVILTGTLVLILNRNQKPDLGTYSDPEMAYLEAKRTMLYVSQTLNYGTKELSNISKINSGVENLRNLEKLNSGLYKLKMLSKINESTTEEKK